MMTSHACGEGSRLDLERPHRGLPAAPRQWGIYRDPRANAGLEYHASPFSPGGSHRRVCDPRDRTAIRIRLAADAGNHWQGRDTLLAPLRRQSGPPCRSVRRRRDNDSFRGDGASGFRCDLEHNRHHAVSSPSKYSTLCLLGNATACAFSDIARFCISLSGSGHRGHDGLCRVAPEHEVEQRLDGRHTTHQRAARTHAERGNHTSRGEHRSRFCRWERSITRRDLPFADDANPDATPLRIAACTGLSCLRRRLLI